MKKVNINNGRNINLRVGMMFHVVVLLFLFSCSSTRKSAPTVPIPEPKAKTETAPVKPKDDKPIITQPVQSVFTVIMPFELRENFAPVEDVSAEPVITPTSLTAIHFYEGCMMAADSLKSLNRDITLKAYESPSDSASLKRILSYPTVKSSGIVFAMLPNHLVQTAADYAQRNGIKLMITSASTPIFLINKPNVVLASASTLTQCRRMVTEMTTLFPGANVILAWRKLKREEELANAFRSELNALKSNLVLHDINVQDNGVAAVTAALSKTKRNIVFVISSDEAHVNPLLHQLEEQNIAEIIVSGLPTWENFASIDFMAFENLRVYIFDNNYIDYKDPIRITFRNQFIKRFSHDPLPTAFNGFDLVFRLGQTMTTADNNMEGWINRSFSNQNAFYQFESLPSGGFENKAISVLRFNDYQLEKLR